MSEPTKLKDMLSGLKSVPTVSEPSTRINIDVRQVSSELDDITYFIEQAKKYRDRKTVARAAVACNALGTYLETLIKEDE